MPSVASQVIAVGRGTTDAQGHYAVTFTPEADERLGRDMPELSYRYRIRAEVTDEGGETRTATHSIRLGFVAVQARG